MTTSVSAVEEEVIFLKAITEIIDYMVNFEMLSVARNDPDSMVRFKSNTHLRLFSIVLVDFLSCTDRKSPVRKMSYLGALRNICRNPALAKGAAVGKLENAVDSFVLWLEQKLEIDLHLPSLMTTAPIAIQRLTFLKICGDISKHNFLRNAGSASELREMLATTGIQVTLDDAMLALADCHDRFHNDVLEYHSSTIVEFLTNIRWGIHEYLQPEYLRSYVSKAGDPPKYSYIYPAGLVREFAKQCYWELMNEVRRKPFMKQFVVAQGLKQRY